MTIALNILFVTVVLLATLLAVHNALPSAAKAPGRFGDDPLRRRRGG